MPFDAPTSFWSSPKALGEGAAAVPTMAKRNKMSPLGFRSRAAEDGAPVALTEQALPPGNPQKKPEWIQKMKKNWRTPGELPTAGGQQQRGFSRHHLEESHSHQPKRNRWNKFPSVRMNG